MPPLQATRLQHIQDVFAGRKKTLKQKDVPARHIPRWPELAVKIIYPQVIDQLKGLRDYLPDIKCSDGQQRFPEREFFYKVLYALYPETVEDLLKQAAAARKGPEKTLQEEAWTMAIKPEWID